MNILMLWEELTEEERNLWGRPSQYKDTFTNCTRPLRMPDDWTYDEEKEMARYIESWTTPTLFPRSIAGKAIDIATRPAPVYTRDKWERAWDDMAEIIGRKWSHDDAERCNAIFKKLKASTRHTEKEDD